MVCRQTTRKPWFFISIPGLFHCFPGVSTKPGVKSTTKAFRRLLVPVPATASLPARYPRHAAKIPRPSPKANRLLRCTKSAVQPVFPAFARRKEASVRLFRQSNWDRGPPSPKTGTLPPFRRSPPRAVPRLHCRKAGRFEHCKPKRSPRLPKPAGLYFPAGSIVIGGESQPFPLLCLVFSITGRRENSNP